MRAIIPINSATISQVGIQKIAVLVAKACLSSVPFAALAFDIGQVAVDLANEQAKGRVTLENGLITGIFLEDLAQRLAVLEEAQKEAIRNSDTHELAAHAALRALISETSKRVPKILSRAVSRLAESSEAVTYKAQCARILEEMSEPVLHALQTNHRFHTSQLTEDELEIIRPYPEAIERMAALLEQTMSVPHWDSVMRRIMQLGLMENAEDLGRFGGKAHIVQTAPSTAYGIMIIDLCFDNLLEPALGRFARQQDD